ncbi:hypothetical protein XH90_17075 [Bradyrhizobium sp. CCBAU 53338]|nr:hypothetical protein XH90_17075 [Bradyrhizobium sp. CCBAU 53338]
MSLLAVDALDLNASGLTRRLENAQASFVDPMGQYQLAFALPTWARGSAPAGAATSPKPVPTGQ